MFTISFHSSIEWQLWVWVVGARSKSLQDTWCFHIGHELFLAHVRTHRHQQAGSKTDIFEPGRRISGEMPDRKTFIEVGDSYLSPPLLGSGLTKSRYQMLTTAGALWNGTWTEITGLAYIYLTSKTASWLHRIRTQGLTLQSGKYV